MTMQKQSNNTPMTTNELISKIKGSTYEEFQQLVTELEADGRKTIQTALSSRQKRHDRELRQLEEHIRRKRYETELIQKGYKLIAGIDEVGRGPLAGPVYAAAVILDPDRDIYGIKDSKKLDEMQREQLSAEIIEKCIAYSIGTASVEEIDSLNILNATKLAMRRAIEGLAVPPDHLLIDALELDGIAVPQLGIIKGDDLSVSIGAASIIAKVARDNHMKKLSEVYPGYSLEKNKGYGTKDHTDALKLLGACSIHRKTFIKNLV